MRCAGLGQGLDELFDRQCRNAQCVPRLQARREHGGDRVLRNLSHGEQRVQHHGLAQQVGEPSKEPQAWNRHVADRRKRIYIQRVSHAVDFLLAVTEHADGVQLGVHLLDLLGHLAITNIELGSKVNHLQSFVVAHGAVDGVLTPADHVVEHVVHRRAGALQAVLLGLDLQTLHKLLWAAAFFKLLFAVERHVVNVVQHVFSLLAAPQLSVNHGLDHVRTDALPCVADVRQLWHVLGQAHAGINQGDLIVRNKHLGLFQLSDLGLNVALSTLGCAGLLVVVFLAVLFDVGILHLHLILKAGNLSLAATLLGKQ